MTPKEIGRKAGSIFRSMLPANWAIRSQEDQEDYGIDYEIELMTPQDQPTGFIFKIQQKGELQLKRNAAGDTVSLSGIAVTKMRYYLEQIDIPVIIVAVGLSDQQCYWTNLQGNPVIEAAHRKAAEQQNESLTVHIPTANRLPETCNSLLESVQRSQAAILVRGIHQLSARGLLDAATSGTAFETLTRSIQRHHDLLRCEQIERLVRENRDEDALRMACSILASPSESVEVRFAAGLNVTRLQGALAAVARSPEGNEDRIRTSLSVASTLLDICRPLKPGSHLRDYARFLIRTARLGFLADKDYGIAMSRAIQRQTGDELAKYITEGAQQQTATAVLRELRRTQVAIVRVIRRGHVQVLPKMWAQLAEDVIPFLLRLRHDELTVAAREIVGWLEAVATYAFKIAVRMKVWNEAAVCIAMYMSLSDPKDRAASSPSRAQTAKGWVQDIDDESERARALQEIAYFEGLSDKAEEDLSPNDEQALCRQMAASLGIDLNDTQDRTAQIVNIGLRDLNPERVLKTCKHLFTSPGAYGMPAQLLGLPTAGSKWLHCTKLGCAVRGKSLDELYGLLRARFCHSCEHRIEHPQDWKWSRQWQRQQDELHQKVAEQAEKGFCGQFGSRNDEGRKS